MKKATLEKVQAQLSKYVSSSAKSPVLIIQNGEPVAMLVGLRHKNHRAPLKLKDVLERAWNDYKENGGIPHEEFWKAVGNRGKK